MTANLSPNPRWVIPWIRTCSRRCAGRLGWLLSTWTRPPVTWPRLTLILIWLLYLLWIKLWWSFGTGYGSVRLRHGRSVLSLELRSWRLQFGNVSLDSAGRLWRCYPPPAILRQLVVPPGECWGFIKRYHDSVFVGHLGVSRTVCRLLDRVYWPGLREDVRSYLVSCSVCLARKSPGPRRAPMGHVSVGHRWDIVAMDILDMSVTTEMGNRYVRVIVDCFSWWTEACPLPNKKAVAVADAFFQLIICHFGMQAVIHSDQGHKYRSCVYCWGHTRPVRHPRLQCTRINRLQPLPLDVRGGMQTTHGHRTA